MPYLHRTLETAFLKASEHFPVLLLTGSRQVGKTTFLQFLSAGNRRYVTLDDPMARGLALDDPDLFLQRFPPPVLIDEIQYAPELLRAIKIQVDRDRSPGRFWLTGSQLFQLMKGVSESLAGRVGIVSLLGFSQAERRGAPHLGPFLPVPERLAERQHLPRLSLQDLYQEIWLGGFPAMRDPLHPPPRDLFFSSYVQTYLQRDVRDLARVGDERAFFRFLQACAARTGQLLNLSDLCRDAEISHPTAKHWLSVLQTSGIIHLLEPFHSHFLKRIVKTPKLYMLDTGLAAYLTGWSSPTSLETGAMNGAFLETWVVTEILKSWRYAGLEAPLFFYRDRDKKKIDLLILQDQTLHPVEIKKSAQPGRDAAGSFQTLDALAASGFRRGHGAVVCLADMLLPLTRDVDAVPVGVL